MERKIVGIIAEYNPLHNGHKYQLSYAKDFLHADYCVVAMSGNFVQRGTPAIIDKNSRARMAIAEGADLVFEIPSCFATGSLDDFSLGAVSLLDSLGIISHLLFGSEMGSIEKISCISKAMMTNESTYCFFRRAMKTGISDEDLQRIELSAMWNSSFRLDCAEAITQPNNILGILYLNSLSRIQSPMIPVTNPRIGQGYLDDREANMHIDNYMASATAIRKRIMEGGDSAISSIRKYIPTKCYSILEETLQEQRPLSENDFWKPLCDALALVSGSLDEYRLITPAIAQKISEGWKKCNSWNSLVSYVANDMYSSARISRCLIHILLGIKEKTVEKLLEEKKHHYVNVLAFSEKGENLLTEVCNRGKISVLHNNDITGLSPEAMMLLQIDHVADQIYAKCKRQ